MKIPVQGIVGREALREAAAQPDLRQVMDLVRAAINAKINDGKPEGERKWFDTEAFYADRMVIDLDGRCWSYPYTSPDPERQRASDPRKDAHHGSSSR